MRVLVLLSIVFATVYSIIVFFRQPWLLCISLGVLLVATLVYIRAKSKTLLAKLGFMGLLCTACEAICINYGVWAYAVPGPFGVPIWLPIAWTIVHALAYDAASKRLF